MKWMVFIVLFSMFGISNIGYTQSQPKTQLPSSSLILPTPEQKIELDSSAKDGKILQLEFEQLKTQYQLWMAKDAGLINSVKQQNKWGDDVQFDSQNRSFYKIHKSATNPPATKAAKK